MDKATKPITDLQRKVRGLVETMSALNRGKYSVKIDTRPATQKIGKLIRALQMAKAEVQQLNAMGVTLGGVGGKKQTTSRTATASPVGGSKQSPRTATKPSRTVTANRYAMPVMKHPTNLGYKIWGPTPLPNNGGMAIDMLKGMGIAYGLAGAGMMVSNIVDQAAEYDNLMKTVENILKSHDTRGNFSSRFSSMSTTVRNVGMETKFKVTEVADAAKFLAMAGLNVEAISQAMRPIADIALVGDTDLGKTADLVTNIMTAYNIAPSKMRNAADIMTNTFTMSNTTLTEIAEAYKYAASLLSAGDVPFEEATAAIGVLGDAGIKGSQAGTTMRTIMANIVNPTKKQQAAWDEIGVSRLNKDGTRKSLLEIFKELNNANIGVDAYYRLFHKTAASGAVALSSHVSKWEDVYLENFLASGLSANLADEKKNTLQGLWAQLTSVFVDRGVTAFNGVQSQLRGMMNTAIGWLKSDQASQVFKEVSKDLMEFIHILIDASKWFVEFYKSFGPIIKAWAKFQLMIWPIVKGVTALRSVFLSILGIRKMGFFISDIATSFRKLGTAAAFASTQVTGVATTSTTIKANTALGSLLTLTPHQLQWVQNGMSIMGHRVMRPLDLTPRYDRGSYDIVARHQRNRQELARVQRERKIYNRRMMMQHGVNIAGGLVGTAALGYGMHKLTDDNDTFADNAAGALYGVAGTAAMVGGPWGWGVAAGAAIIGGIMQVIGSAQKSTKVYGEIQDFASKNAIQSGIIAGSESKTMQYLEAQATKYTNINNLVQKRIELTAKLLGLQQGDNPMDASTGVFQSLMEKHEDLWDTDNLKAFNAIYRDKFKTDKKLVYNSGDGRYYLTSASSLRGKYVSENGRQVYRVIGNNGEEAIKVGNTTTNGLEAAFASMAATAEVMSPGGYYEKLVEGMRMNVAKLGMKGTTIKEFDDYINQISKANDPQYLKNLVGLEDIVDTDWDLNRMLLDKQTRLFMWSQLQPLLRNARESFVAFKQELDVGTMSVPTLTNYLKHVIGNQPGLAIKDYNPEHIGNWYANYGYWNGKFNGYSYTDENGITHSYNAEEAAKLAASNMESILGAIKQSGVAATPAAKELQTFASTLLALSQSFIGTADAIEGSRDGETRELNGQTWRWNAQTKQWELLDDNDQPAQISQGLINMSNGINTLFTTIKDVEDNWFNPSNWWNKSTSLSTNGGGAYYGPLILEDNNQQSDVPWLMPFAPWSKKKNTQQQVEEKKSKITLSPQQFGNAYTNLSNGGKNNNVGSNGGGAGSGTNSSDYKSHQKERAIPKQININIQNLMKVDSIDLTNADNVAIIDRMKREVAYALYEAAADGTMMLNGLANQ